MHTSCAFASAQSACGDPISSACAPHRSYSSAGDEEKAQRRWRPTGRGNVALRRPSAAAQPQPNAQIAHAPLDCLRANGPLQQRCIRRKTRGAVVHINRNAPRLSSVYTSACKHARLGNIQQRWAHARGKARLPRGAGGRDFHPACHPFRIGCTGNARSPERFGCAHSRI